MSEIHPDLVRPLRFYPDFTFTRWTVPLIRAGMGLARFLTRVPDGVEIEEKESDGARLRIIRPVGSTPKGALLWLHGGGLIVGTPALDDARCATFARELDLVVVSAYYRLAPRHPFPAALDDCRAAWGWLLSRAEPLGFDPSRIAIGGESAGGGLAASLAQRLHDEGGVQPAGQLLLYPMLDDRTAARRDLDAEDHPVWNNRSNRTGWSSYLGTAPGAGSIPDYAVPARRENLGGLPPAWIGVGLLDLFLDEDREYARRLKDAGVPCHLEEVPGAVHGFTALAPSAAITREFTSSQLSFLRAHLEG